MEKTQHTPGPWQHQPLAGEHDFAVYEESSGRDIALVRDFNEPNARLIAAAPELLEKLRNLLIAGRWDEEGNFVIDHEPWDGHGEPPDISDPVVIQQAWEVIDKATR